MLLRTCLTHGTHDIRKAWASVRRMIATLQDVHWYGGPIGGVFQGYTLGNIMAAQFYAAALKAHPEIPSQIRQGQFATFARVPA